jgi:uncharacterized membrane protein (TIGR02234 family)
MAERRGLLWAVVAMLVVAAIALWIASLLVWSWEVKVTGGIGVPRELRGGQAEPALVGLAVAGLAAVAAVLATSGWPRRAVGVLLLAGGAGALVLARRGLARPGIAGISDAGTERWAGEINRWSAQAGTGVALAALAGVLLVVSGVLVLVAGHRMPRMGSRYQRAPKTGVPEQTGSQRAVGDRAVDDRGAHERALDERIVHERSLWDELDAGRDPTTE